MNNEAYHRSYQRSIDFSRVRENTGDPQHNFISYGTVGHYDDTPAYARIEDGDVLVEVTLLPAGDEITARIDFDSVDGGGAYMPLSFGQRVVIAFPNGDSGEAVIIGRCSDRSWPFPPEVSEIPTSKNGKNAPCFAFLKTQDGQLLAIETGTNADIVIHSGASIQLKCTPSSQNLITGRTHIGSDVEFSSQPTPATVGGSGFVEEGDAGGLYEPAENTRGLKNLKGQTYPSNGVVRLDDSVIADGTTDPAFFAWVSAVSAAIIPPIAPVPFQIESAPTSSSLNTVGDD